MRSVALENAVGLQFGHDITEVNVAKKIKGRAFKKGQMIVKDDLERLRDLGKNIIYVLEGNEEEVHEDEAALMVAPLIAGNHVTYDSEPKEGKISFYADCKGLFKVDVERLYRINSLEIPSLPTLHSNFSVGPNQQIAAFRIIPLFCQNSIIEEIKAKLETPLIEVKPYLYNKAGIIVTGNEVFKGRVRDAFIPRISQILKPFDVDVIRQEVLPDEKNRISACIKDFSNECDIVFVTGGTSVDPDDQTVAALADAGVRFNQQGNPIQPGNNFTIGYKGNTAICAVPAAAIHFRATALDVFLPRLLVGERISKEDVYRAGHGGLCHFCEKCHYPVCPFAITE